MIHTILNVIYVLIAVSIVALILLQRGAGAQAGSGFGAGASATVFGSRGSANFLSSATKWLAVAFFGLSLFMAWQAGQAAKHSGTTAPDTDAGVMGEAPATGESPAGLPAAATPLPATPAPAPAAAPVIAPATPAATPVTPAPQEPATQDKGR